ncbi:MAG: DUF4912 domain-containing protein [Candidatus Omnitrophota bacterium]
MKRILNNVRKGFKKVMSRKLVGKKVLAKVIKPKTRPPSLKKEPGVKKVPIEVAVEKSKFYIAPGVEEVKAQYPMPMLAELPSGYAQDKIIIQVRDPWWVHAYWEVTEFTWERLKGEFPEVSRGEFKRVLRVYDISHIIFTGDNAHRFSDIGISPEATNWYIDTNGPGRSWCVDLGIILKDGRFITIVRSNTISTPLDGPSRVTDEEWMIPDDMFSRLYGMGVGIGSSPLKLKKLAQKRFKSEFGSGALFSAFSPVKKRKDKGKGKGFWLVVNTELIVYGQTEPDAKLTVAGHPVELRPDGSFSLRFFLPDGKQTIPVIATSSDSEQVRRITPVVTKETK